MTDQPNELLPCQVSDAMIEAVQKCQKGSCHRHGRCMYLKHPQCPLTYKASTIPTDGNAEWLRDMAHEIRKCGYVLKAEFSINLTDGLERIANRLSIIPSAGEIERFWPRPWSATRPGGEEMVQVLDAHGRTILRLEWPFHSEHDADAAEQATYALSDAIAALSIQTISGKGMREVLVDAREAIASLDTEALGMAQIAFGEPGVDVYPIRDELLAKIDAALVDQGERG